MDGRVCSKCQLPLDPSGICSCDPEWISPEEMAFIEDITEKSIILQDVQNLLEKTLIQKLYLPPAGLVTVCFGCNKYAPEGEILKHEDCLPFEILTRIKLNAAKGARYAKERHMT